jgi:hypothetical protein
MARQQLKGLLLQLFYLSVSLMANQPPDYRAASSPGSADAGGEPIEGATCAAVVVPPKPPVVPLHAVRPLQYLRRCRSLGAHQ